MQERRILHVDLNNFYASVECLDRPELKNVPMAVTGSVEERHGIVLAKNELAKACGVRTAETVWQAKRKCPALVCVPPHHEKYARYSARTRQLYRTFSDRVEAFSLDEAWLDMTGFAGTDREVGDLVRETVKKELSLTVSVGVSFNKVFAKLGSDMKKPDGTTVISRENYRQRVWPLPVEELLYVGAATKSSLNAIGIFTIGQLAAAEDGVIARRLGKSGAMLLSYARGEDASEVESRGDPVKSVGNSATAPQDLTDEKEVQALLYLLSESVASRLRKRGLQGSTVCLSIRDNAFHTVTRQTRLPRPTRLSGEIARCAMALFRENYRWTLPVRALGVTLGGLSADDEETQLDCFAEERQDRAAQERLESAIDGLRRRYGKGAVQRGCVMGSAFAKEALDAEGGEAAATLTREQRRED